MAEVDTVQIPTVTQPTAGETVATMSKFIKTAGLPTDAANANTDATGATHTGILKQLSKTLQAAVGAVATAFFSKITDGTNTAAVDATHGLKVLAFIDPAGVNNNVNADNVNSLLPGAPVTAYDYYGDYEPVAASVTDQVMGAGSGAAGNYLSHVVIIPGTLSPGAVSIKDGAGSAITIFAGGANSVLTLHPFGVPLGIYCATAWKITTGANVTAIGVGKF